MPTTTTTTTTTNNITGKTYRCPLTVISELPRDLGRIPMSVRIDFGAMIEKSEISGVFDPNSIELIDLSDGTSFPFARTEDFVYGDAGRIEWTIDDPDHRQYEIRFRTASERPPLIPQDYVPMVGVGDLLRYNAGIPRPITVAYSMRMADITGDGKADLVGCWNYYHRPGSPISGIICYPRIGDEADFVFGDMVRLRYVTEIDSDEYHHFPGTYIQADFADFNGNGLMDIAYANMGDTGVTIFLNTGRRDPGGMPVFVRDSVIPAPVSQNAGICAVDLNGNGTIDLVVNGHLIRNLNPEGWPFEAADPVDLKAGKNLTFIDLNGNGRLDAIDRPARDLPRPRKGGVIWKRNEGGDPRSFSVQPPIPTIEIDTALATMVAAVSDGSAQGILVQHEQFQNISFYRLTGNAEGQPVFELEGCAKSLSAPLMCSNQAWPSMGDWNGNGVTDLVVGGGFGWSRIVVNSGSNDRPAWEEPRLIQGEGTIRGDGGAPVKVTRDEILQSRHWHNFGYPYPAFVDWDGDGLPDLMLPNETNRILWCRNIGTRMEPAFEPLKYLEVDGYPDSPELRAETGRLCENPDLHNTPYPYDPSSPIYWRTGAAFADWNGDGLMDFITHDEYHKATLFVQYRRKDGTFGLRKERRVLLIDGREIDDSIVGRTKHWTESFRAVDWDGNGLMDLLYNCAGSGKIYLLKNMGRAEEPVFDLPREFKCYGEDISFTIHGPNAWPGDLNGDGKPDLLGCVEWSVYPFYAHAALEMDAHPSWELGDIATLTEGGTEAIKNKTDGI